MTNYPFGQQTSPIESLTHFFRRGSALSILILINIAIWLLVQVVQVLAFFSNIAGHEVLETIKQSFAIPASIPLIMTRPWTMVTYMFLHFDIWHILFNMLWLYWFGRIFTEFLPSRVLVWTYLLGGIFGGLMYVVAFNLLPVFQPVVNESFALGASASVMAIVTAIAMYVPNYSIQLILIGRLKIIYLAAILFVSDFFMIPSGNAGGHIAHIGGALFGALFISVYRIPKSLPGFGMKGSFFETVGNLFSRNRKKGQNSPFDGYRRPVSDEDYNLRKKENQEKVDKILEKISKGGYDCLTKEEKDFLFKSSHKG